MACAVLPAKVDLRDQPIDVAIERTLDRLEATYAFTDHKQLDWDAARRELLPMARSAQSEEAIDNVIRHLVPWLPDAHVLLFNDDADRDLCPAARASLGLVLSDTDSGPVIIAASSDPGLLPGDAVIRWQGLPIEAAIETAPLHCFPIGAATLDRRRQAALRTLERAATGETVTFEVVRGGQPLRVELQGAPDTTNIREAFRVQSPETLLQSETLPGGVAYIALGWEETWVAETRFQRALASHAEAPALVLDLRDNDGGMERTAANIAGFFTRERTFYETVTFLNNRTLEQVVMSQVWMEPQELYWARPVAVLVDADTVSSGEGLAMLLARAPQVEVVGFEGTAASFGSTGSGVRLPGGWTLNYPGGQSLDASGAIQLDSDETLQGGVHPTLRVPWTVDNRVRHAAGEDVVLEAALAHLGGL
jgi:carboxyl-terminal processing protease